jgi:exonuclease VII large subunit
LSPAATLGRGYAHVRQSQDGRTVTSPRQVRPGQGLTVRVAEGGFDVVVSGQASLFDLEAR